MAQKRRFGRVRKLASGRWQARYPGPDGLDRPAPHTFANKTDANVWLADKEAEIRRNDWIDPDAGLELLSVFGAAWIAERPNLRPRTMVLYKSLFRVHVLPVLGSFGVAAISPGDVRRWHKNRRDAGVGPVTLAKAYRLLKAMLNTAVEDGLIRRNPCQIKGAGTERSPERRTVSVGQVYALADVIQPRYKLLVLLAVFAMMRWGELMGLRRCDFDLETGYVDITRAVQEVGGQQIVSSPKTWAGRRRVAIPASIMPVVRWHLRVFAEPGPDGRVFVGPRGATPSRSNFHRIWRRATLIVGVPWLHFHDLRHTGATLAARTGATLRELMDLLGQSTARAAMIYQHASNDHARVVADGLDAFVEEYRKQNQQTGDDDDPPLIGALTGT